MSGLLEEILEHKHEELRQAKARVSLDELQERMSGHNAHHRLRDAIAQPGRLHVIAELKRKSPSKGMLRERFDPVQLAQTLEEAGASALSVLTDEKYFGGHLDFLRDARHFTDIPVLRKDFVVDAYQIYEAAFYEADAVLLIVRILEDERLRECIEAADSMGLDALVEVHSEEELERAVRAKAPILGINARDLTTFKVHPERIASIIARVPEGIPIVAESGIQTARDLERLQGLGVRAAIIGEVIMTAPDPAAKVRELLASP